MSRKPRLSGPLPSAADAYRRDDLIERSREISNAILERAAESRRDYEERERVREETAAAALQVLAESIVQKISERSPRGVPRSKNQLREKTKKAVIEMRTAGMSHEAMCDRLTQDGHSTPLSWNGLTFKAAFINSRSKVDKYLSLLK